MDTKIDIDSNDIIENNSETKLKLTKNDLLVINNSWNNKNEELIVSLGYTSAIYKSLHEQTSGKYERYNKCLSLSLLILSVFLSADSIINISPSEIIMIFQKIIIFLIAIFSIFNSFLKFGELSTQHSYSANSYSIIYHDIQHTMCMYRRDRPHAIKYIQNIMREYDHLEVSSPSISESLINKMNNNLKHSNMSIPKLADKIQKIEIISENNIHNMVLDSTENINPKFKINNTPNLKELHECFKIDGELCEEDNISISEFKNTHEKWRDYHIDRFYNNNC